MVYKGTDPIMVLIKINDPLIWNFGYYPESFSFPLT